MIPPTSIPHLTLNFKTNNTLSFVYSKLVRHKVGADDAAGHLHRWSPTWPNAGKSLDDTTYVFYLRQGVKWHNKPPVNGRELVAEDVKFTYDRFLTEPGNPPPFYARSRGPGRGHGSLYREVPPERALRLAGQRAGQPDGHLDHRPRSGGEVWRPEESRERHWHRPLPPGALRAERQDGLQAQPGLLPPGPAVCGWGGVVGPRGRIDRAGDVSHRANRLRARGTIGPCANRTWTR